MEFGQKSRKENKLYASSGKIHAGHLTAKYPLALQFYDLPPTDNISLLEFGQLAVERLKVLRTLEKLRLKHPRQSKEFNEALVNDLRKEGLLGYIKKTPEDPQDADPVDQLDRRKDHISHFILRLAYCKTEELRRWFIRQETDLFMNRLENESRFTISRFLSIAGIHFEPISENEKRRIYDKVRQVSSMDIVLTEGTDFYKVLFTEILDLVSKRRVYLENGFGFIKLREMSHILSNRFRSNLSRSLVASFQIVWGWSSHCLSMKSLTSKIHPSFTCIIKIAARALPNLDEDTRLKPLLDSLHMSYVGKDYTTSAANGKITRQMVDSLSDKSFPLCMSQLHQAFRETHHLRHGGRLQYTLFLKGIGMSLEEVLAMWREEFTRVMDGDKFEKQYSYNIRHSFGKEGKRVNYTPYSCMKIIMSSAPGNGDHHGCPFRHSDQGLLKERLVNLKVQPSGVREIMDLVQKGHYQIACSRYFELINNSVLKQSINHPNEYFEESYKLTQGLIQPRQDSGLQQIKSTQVYASQLNSQNTETQCKDPTAFGDDDFDSVMASIE